MAASYPDIKGLIPSTGVPENASIFFDFDDIL